MIEEMKENKTGDNSEQIKKKLSCPFSKKQPQIPEEVKSQASSPDKVPPKSPVETEKISISDRINSEERNNKLVSFETERSGKDESVKSQESILPDNCIFSLIGGEESVQKFLEVFVTKLEANDDLREPLKDMGSQEDPMHIGSLIQLIFKAKQVDNSAVKNHYQPFKLTEDDFKTLVSVCRMSIIASKKFKMPMLKQAIMEISDLRDLMVYDPSFEMQVESQDVEQTLYLKLGSIEGISKLLAKVFDKIMEDPVLKAFYKDKNMQVMSKKYAYYMAG